MRWFCAFFVKLVLGCVIALNVQSMVLTQDDYLYRVWSVDAGLPQISVTAIEQDADGFLWLGTQSGLARFDGVQFDVFNTSNTPQMSSNLITALHFDVQGGLWIGSVNGLMRYQHGTFSRLDLAQPLQGAVSGFAELSDGSIYIGGNHLWQWQQDKMQAVTVHQGPVFQLYQHNDNLYVGGQDGFASLINGQYQWHAAPQTIAGVQISEIAIQDGQLYLGTTFGLYRWQAGVWQAVTLPGANDDRRIELLYLDQQQRLWVTTYSHVYKMRQGVVERADVVKGKHQDFVWVESMLQDKHQNLWFGSRSHGLKRLRKPPTQRFSVAEGIPDPYVWAVMPWQQHLLVGTSAGMSLLQHGQFQPLMANQYLPNPFVYSFLLDDDQLWVGTRAGLSLLDANTLGWRRNFDQIAHLLVTTLAREDDTLWVGTNGGLYYLQHDELLQHKLPEALTKVKVRIVLPDSQNRLWVGTENGLFVRDDNGFHPVTDIPLAGSFISMIKQFDDGNLLIGSFDQGFLFGSPGNWQWFNQQRGLPGNGVIHVEKIENQLVISNFEGFYRMDYSALLQGKVDKLYMLVDDRRPEAETDSHRCCNGAGSSKGTVHQGRLWFPTLNGVVSLPLQQLIQYNHVPQPVINALSAGNEKYYGEKLSLPPEQRDWQVSFTAPYYVQASSLQLRYQLRGYDSNWIDAGSRRDAFYTNLPPGHYRFLLQVRVAGDYRWSETVETAIELQPHWHETSFARVALLLLLAVLLWGLYHWRLLALARSRRQLASLVAERTYELHQANEKLQQMSMQDALTGLYNRHYLDTNIHAIQSRAQRHSTPLIWAVLDLDHFKQINDSQGHHVGDEVLIAIADILRQNSRGSDHLIRWGGEEFLLILEAADDAVLALERIQQAIRQYPWTETLGIAKPLTCSIGAVAKPVNWDWQQSLKLADQALYRVKQSGRNGYLLLQATVPVATLSAENRIDDLLANGSLTATSDLATLTTYADNIPG
ncbi:ligand-binding sensor domain-containing diguanylate cyclase [Rheinheimera maricola]|uniref:diguanylate cyclase n=1 Tax=Rheinheimera maricola TaxID=2793282 RepID=A0ABS7X7Q0_9GAMM|nr:ligand-binding sensor domain-containing diguanylate cyclase [Rheinheimera maricola]MBZ9611569.1 diguanylate cyclase [Rheinheimera maricola]